MADYRELLRRAVSALPENNGAARRDVYEKARSALVSQLRAIDPPLPAREITQHQLQLEDCIREVEQEATETLLGGLRHSEREPNLGNGYRRVQAAPNGRDAETAVIDKDVFEADHETRTDREPLPSEMPDAEADFDHDGPDDEEDDKAALAAVVDALEHDDAPEFDEDSGFDDEPDPEDEPEFDDYAEPDEAESFDETAEFDEEDLSRDDAEDDDAEGDGARSDATTSIEEIIARAQAVTAEAPSARSRVSVVAPPKTARRQANMARVEEKKTARKETGGAGSADKTRTARPAAKATRETAEPTPEKPRQAKPARNGREAAPVANGRDTSAPRRSEEPARERPSANGRRASQSEPAAEKRDSGQVDPATARSAATNPSAGKNGARPAEAPADDEEMGNAYEAAMASVREVEPQARPRRRSADPQEAIDRAIAALDREARGEQSDEQFDDEGYDEGYAEPGVEAIALDHEPEVTGKRKWSKPAPKDRSARHLDNIEPLAGGDSQFARSVAEEERSGGFGALTIFLALFLVLLIAAAGAGYWAWREGYVDLASVFGQNAAPASQQASTPTTGSGSATGTGTPTPKTNTASKAPNTSGGNTVEMSPDNGAMSSGQAGNTTVAPRNVTPTAPAAGADTSSGATSGNTATPSAPTPSATPEANTGETKNEARLPTADNSPQPKTGQDNAQAANLGAQSLLLEAQPGGTTGAVPFSGTVDWSRGTDERGQPTIVAKANIPARNLSVQVTLRKNSDKTLPASHLMEIDFKVNDSFVGGTIAALPGVLLKNEELVQGKPLVGASARVVTNSFLFALSSAKEDVATNVDLLTSRKWMDLAVIYGTGRRAIITLEKDDAAQKLFDQVFKAWGETPSASSGN